MWKIGEARMWETGCNLTHIITGNVLTLTGHGPYPNATCIDSTGIVVIDNIRMFRRATTMDMMRDICGKN